MSGLKRTILRALYGMPGPMRKRLYNIYDRFVYPELREQKKSYGEQNSDKTFYVIRPYTNSNEGLMSLLLNVCRHIIYAEKKGFIPIVDFLNYKTQYSDDRNENIWEDYFRQLSPYDLDEVYSSKNVILCGLKPTREEYFEPYVRFEEDEVSLARSIIKKYIRLSSEAAARLLREEQHIRPAECIGVYLRGTDYLTIKPVGHYIQPTVEQAAEYIDSYLETHDVSRIFLVTEDDGIYRKMLERYPEKLTVAGFDSFISDYAGEGYLFSSDKLDQISPSRYERGMNYLIKELLLSRCPCIVGGNTCGSWAAVAFSEEDTRFHIFDLGQY